MRTRSYPDYRKIFETFSANAENGITVKNGKFLS
jgi:hypothetical protein